MVGNNHSLWHELTCLSCKQLPLPAGCQDRSMESFGIFLDNVERLGPDTTGASQNCDIFNFVVHNIK